MKKSNKKNVNKKLIPLIITFITLLVLSGMFLIYLYTQNYITVEHIDNASSKIKSEDVTSVSPIIINNVVVGGVSDKGKWINKDNIYGKTNITKGLEIDMYNISGKMGTYEIYSVSEDKEKEVTYAVPLKNIMEEEYIATLKSDTNIMPRTLTKIEPS